MLLKSILQQSGLVLISAVLIVPALKSDSALRFHMENSTLKVWQVIMEYTTIYTSCKSLKLVISCLSYTHTITDVFKAHQTERLTVPVPYSAVDMRLSEVLKSSLNLKACSRPVLHTPRGTTTI